MTDYLIFTDLDGTLLDHYDYNFSQAQSALETIAQLKIPLLINSSKTYAEIKQIRTQMHNNSAFSVENGAAIFFPTSSPSKIEPVILGTPIKDILKVLHQLRITHGFYFKGFSDYSTEELMIETGLTENQANDAKQRLASEPIKWLDTEENLSLFKQMLKSKDLQLVEGGRFFHVMGKNDKSSAMAWLLNKFNQEKLNQDIETITIALGDSHNDKKMLEQADFAAVIKKIDNTHLQLNKSPECIFYSEHPAPLGWQESIEYLLAKLNIGEGNE